MGCGDTSNVGIDSMDLYSRVKLRTASGKVPCVCEDIFVAKDERVVNAGIRKPRAYFGRRVSVKSKNSAQGNVLAVQNSKLTSLIAVTEKETQKWRNGNQDLSNQCANPHGFDQFDLLHDEGTAIEMLAEIGKGRTKKCLNRFDVGDLVWGKIQSHPWWPGQIFDEALAPPSVFSTKREGCVLVAFYGDYTYGWLHGKNLIPFDVHYAEKSKQTNAALFLTAVEEAKYEIKRRAALGLVCHCQSPSNFRPTEVRGYLEVDVSGYNPGGIYSAKQIEKAREDFSPNETLSFLKHLALNPKKDVPQSVSWMKNLAKVLTVQQALLDKFAENYSEAFEMQQRSSEDPTGIKNAPQASLDSFLVPKVPTKEVLGGATGANHLQKCEVNVSWSWFSGEGSGDHGKQNGSKRSNCSGSEVPNYISLQKQPRPDGPLNAGNKSNISGCQETLSMKKSVKLRKIESLARSAGKQQLLDLQGGEVKGTGATSSIKVEKDSDAGTNSLRNCAEPTMLVVKFPPHTMMPSISELKAKFAPFGPLVESSLCVFWKSSTCQIVFQYKANAEAAYHHAMRNRTLFSSQVSYNLQAFFAASELYKPGELVNHGVEEGHEEIQPQTSLSSDDFSSELKPTFQQLHLIPENIQMNCQEEGSNCPSGPTKHSLANFTDNPEISQHLLPLSSPSTFPSYSNVPYVNEQIGINHFGDIKYCQVEAMRNNDHQATTSTYSLDVSRQLINLLTSCRDILGELKHSSQLMP